MKKTLLFAITACFAMSMNAQVIKHSTNATATVKQSTELANATYNTATVKAQPAKLTVDVNARKAARKAAAAKVSRSQGEMMGKYYEQFVMDDVTLSLPVNLETATSSDGSTYVEISGLFRGWGQSVVGLYDAEAGTLSVPADQYVGDYDNNGQNLYLVCYGCEDAGDGEHLNLRGDFDEAGNLGEGGFDDLVFNVVEEDGNYYLSMETGWILVAYTALDETAESLGTLTYDLEGETLCQTNWGANYESCHVENGSWTPWERQIAPIYAEKYDDSVVLFGFEDQFTVELALDAEAGTCALYNQDLYMSSGNMFGVHVIVDGEVTNDYDAYVDGVYSPANDYVGVYTVEGEDVTDKFFLICTEYEPGVGAYMIGEYVAAEFVSLKSPLADQVCPELLEGVNTVLAPEANAKAGRYNLAGQRTNTYVKGINIENGKKVVR